MAAYRKSAVPALKVTRWSTSGEKSTSSVHRRLDNTNTEATSDQPQIPRLGNELQNPIMDFEMMSHMQDNSEPTEHELSCLSSVAGWDEIRDKLRTAVTENAAMPQGQICINCAEIAWFRCQRCGPLGYFCSLSCYSHLHSGISLFHVPEKWEVSF